MATESSLPPDLFDTTTIVSLVSTLAIVLAASAASRACLPAGPATPRAVRLLFVWHLADALCHFLLEGSFLYHCLFTWRPRADFDDAAGRGYFATPEGYLGGGGGSGTGTGLGNGHGHGHGEERVYGAQAGSDPFAQLWMVYARADRRWGGVDLGVVSLELLTVFFDGPLAVYICYCLAKRDARVSIWMIILATCELYGGFMTFCPEWLIGNPNLDTSNFMYLWVYLVFFNTIWVWIPLWVIWYSVRDISGALSQRRVKKNL